MIPNILFSLNFLVLFCCFCLSVVACFVFSRCYVIRASAIYPTSPLRFYWFIACMFNFIYDIFGKDENLQTVIITGFMNKPIWMDTVFFNVIMISRIINLATLWRAVTCCTSYTHKKFQCLMPFKALPTFTSC